MVENILELGEFGSISVMYVRWRSSSSLSLNPNKGWCVRGVSLTVLCMRVAKGVMKNRRSVELISSGSIGGRLSSTRCRCMMLGDSADDGRSLNPSSNRACVAILTRDVVTSYQRMFLVVYGT